jgi:hypothetical protein
MSRGLQLLQSELIGVVVGLQARHNGVKVSNKGGWQSESLFDIGFLKQHLAPPKSTNKTVGSVTTSSSSSQHRAIDHGDSSIAPLRQAVRALLSLHTLITDSTRRMLRLQGRFARVTANTTTQLHHLPIGARGGAQVPQSADDVDTRSRLRTAGRTSTEPMVTTICRTFIRDRSTLGFSTCKQEGTANALVVTKQVRG